MLDIVKSDEYSGPVLLKRPLCEIQSFKISGTELVLAGGERDSLRA